MRETHSPQIALGPRGGIYVNGVGFRLSCFGSPDNVRQLVADLAKGRQATEIVQTLDIRICPRTLYKLRRAAGLPAPGRGGDRSSRSVKARRLLVLRDLARGMEPCVIARRHGISSSGVCHIRGNERTKHETP